jgi:hypothetical protein
MDAPEFLSALAERLGREAEASCVIVVGDIEGGMVGVFVGEHELAAMAGQLRLLADTLAERAAAGLN